jgi:hypothetical protein
VRTSTPWYRGARSASARATSRWYGEIPTRAASSTSARIAGGRVPGNVVSGAKAGAGPGAAATRSAREDRICSERTSTEAPTGEDDDTTEPASRSAQTGSPTTWVTWVLTGTHGPGSAAST